MAETLLEGLKRLAPFALECATANLGELTTAEKLAERIDFEIADLKRLRAAALAWEQQNKPVEPVDWNKPLQMREGGLEARDGGLSPDGKVRIVWLRHVDGGWHYSSRCPSGRCNESQEWRDDIINVPVPDAPAKRHHKLWLLLYDCQAGTAAGIAYFKKPMPTFGMSQVVEIEVPA